MLMESRTTKKLVVIKMPLTETKPLLVSKHYYLTTSTPSPCDKMNEGELTIQSTKAKSTNRSSFLRHSPRTAMCVICVGWASVTWHPVKRFTSSQLKRARGCRRVINFFTSLINTPLIYVSTRHQISPPKARNKHTELYVYRRQPPKA